MKRLALSLLAVIVLVAGIIMVFTSRGGEGERTELGHARQAFFRHVGTYWAGACPTNDELTLYLVDSFGITEFSQYSNLQAAELVESSSGRAVPLARVPSSDDDIPAASLQDLAMNDSSGLAYRALTLGFELDPDMDGLVADRVRVTFIDGVTEDYPVGSILLRHVKDMLYSFTSTTFVDQAGGTLYLPDGRFQQGDYPGGRNLYGFMFSVGFYPDSDEGKRVVDVDLGVPGLKADWASAISLNDEKLLASQTLADYRETLGENAEWYDLFWGKMEALRADGGKLFPDYKHIPQVAPQVLPNFQPLGLAECSPSGLEDDMMVLERAYQLYYDPKADFTNTCLILQPMLILELDGQRLFAALDRLPETVRPCRIADVPGLLEAQNP